MISASVMLEQSDKLSDSSRHINRTTSASVSEKMSDMGRARVPKKMKDAAGRRARLVRAIFAPQMTIRAYSKLIGFEEDTYGSWEAGRNMLPAYGAAAICRKFPKIRFEWLLDGDDSNLTLETSRAIDRASKELADKERSDAG